MSVSPTSAGSFQNCDQLLSKYPNGISVNKKSLSNAPFSAKKSKIKISRDLYNEYQSLDGDKDGLICEARKTKKSNPSKSLSTTPTTLARPAISIALTEVPLSGVLYGYLLGGPRIDGAPSPALDVSNLVKCGESQVSNLNKNFLSGSISPCSATDGVILFFKGIIPRADRGLQRMQFVVRFDDGLKILVNNQTLIDNWRDGAPRTERASAAVNSDTDTPIEIWYYENTGLGVVEVKWQTLSTGQPVVVPTTPRSAVTAPPTTFPRPAATAPSTTALACIPDQFSLRLLETDVNRWRSVSSNPPRVTSIPQNFSGREADFLRAYGDYYPAVWKLNNDVYNAARSALLVCKRVRYAFDDYDAVMEALKVGKFLSRKAYTIIE